MVNIGNTWDEILKDEFQKDYYLELRNFLKKEYSTRVVYPNMYDIFNAFKKTSYEDVKIVILGQDPYHGEGQAHGYAFSVKKGMAIPPSLQNIYRELRDDIGFDIPSHGCLEEWAERGILLLNTALTVRAGQANSHKGRGWEQFTDALILAVARQDRPIVFLLWGAAAQKKAAFITNRNHLVLKAPHPSPLSAYRGFFHCKHFSKCNDFLTGAQLAPIDWQIENI